MDSLLIILTAIFVGLMVGLTGVGGGAVMTPALIILFQVPAVIAIATDLVFATITKLIGSTVHQREKAIDWVTARLIWTGSVPGALLGTVLVVLLGTAFGVWLAALLAAVLLVTSCSMLLSRSEYTKNHWGKLRTRFGGLLIGFSVATTSVGAGALGMALLRARLGDSEPRKLVGTDIAHAIPIALIAGVGYGFTGLIDFSLLLNLLVGSIPGVLIGSVFASRMNTVFLRRILGIVLGVAAIGVILKIL